MVWCAFCGDQFDPVEYREADRVDPDEPSFCSDECEEADELGEVYVEARHSGAPAL